MRGGLPHSEIPGSRPARGSPGLIAACHVLHRLSAPRHPPDALLSLAPPRRRRRRLPGTGARETHCDPRANTTTTTERSRELTSKQSSRHARARDAALSRASRDARSSIIDRAGPSRAARVARRHHTIERNPSGPMDGPGRPLLLVEGRQQSPAARGVALVGPGRLERPTSRLSGARSNRLSYGPAPPPAADAAAAVSLVGKGCADGAPGRLDRRRGTRNPRGGGGAARRP